LQRPLDDVADTLVGVLENDLDAGFAGATARWDLFGDDLPRVVEAPLDRFKEGRLAGAVRPDDADDSRRRRREPVDAGELLVVFEFQFDEDHAAVSSVLPSVSASRIAWSRARRPRSAKSAAKSGS